MFLVRLGCTPSPVSAAEVYHREQDPFLFVFLWNDGDAHVSAHAVCPDDACYPLGGTVASETSLR